MNDSAARRNGREVPGREVEQHKMLCRARIVWCWSQTFLPGLGQRSGAMRMGGMVPRGAGASEVKPSANKTTGAMC